MKKIFKTDWYNHHRTSCTSHVLQRMTIEGDTVTIEYNVERGFFPYGCFNKPEKFPIEEGIRHFMDNLQQKVAFHWMNEEVWKLKNTELHHIYESYVKVTQN